MTFKLFHPLSKWKNKLLVLNFTPTESRYWETYLGLDFNINKFLSFIYTLKKLVGNSKTSKDFSISFLRKKGIMFLMYKYEYLYKEHEFNYLNLKLLKYIQESLLHLISMY